MKRLSIVAALVAIVVAVPLSIGSSHREAPLTSIDPTADDTDVYAYTAKDAPDTLTVVANWVPFEDPAGGPNFYKFDQKARYYINVDNTGDGKYDVRYRFKFRDKSENGGSSFLYALPGVSSIDDPKLLQKQFYDVERLSYGYAQERFGLEEGARSTRARAQTASTPRASTARKQRVLRSVRTVARNIPVAPNNVGPKTIPNYDKVANQAITELPGGGKVFAGQRDDPFFVDLGMTFDAINLEGRRAGQGGKDDLAGYGVHSIVLQVPEEKVTRDGDEVDSAKDKNAVVGVWASTERKRVSVLASQQRRRRRRLRAGLPPREPARERGHHPGRARRTSSTARLLTATPSCTAVRGQAGAGGDPEPAVQRRRSRDQPRWTSSRRCSRGCRA